MNKEQDANIRYTSYGNVNSTPMSVTGSEVAMYAVLTSKTMQALEEMVRRVVKEEMKYGEQFTAIYEDTFIADGNTKAFVLKRQPTGIINVQVNGIEQTKGIFGYNQATLASYQAFIDFPNHQIVFENNVTAGYTVYIKYIYDKKFHEEDINNGTI